ncbi:TRIC cation channel family protein [Thalassospira lucentensis]|uniref:TRIC cation channel family protein n=1 Tax=Thalassospira lucentensis TaxID=168935 RepID=UPI003D2EC967
MVWGFALSGRCEKQQSCFENQAWFVTRFLALFTALIMISVGLAHASTAEKHLRVGWYPSHPYQYTHLQHGTESLTGLDIELTREILKRAGYSTTFIPTSWAQVQRDLRDGKVDMALGAFENPERSEYAYFSEAYRVETDSVFFQNGASIAHNAESFAHVVENIAAADGHIGVLDGYSYGIDVDQTISGTHNDRVVAYDSIEKALQSLEHGQIDALLSDQVFVESALIRDGYGNKIDRHSMPVFSGDIHAMFSRATVSQETVDDFNIALRTVRNDGTHDSIIQSFVTPIRFGIALSGRWFTALDILGTVAFAISGVLLARREGYSIFGAFVLSALPGVGGGVVRDLLSGREPIGIMQSPNGILLVIGTVLAGYIIYFIFDRLPKSTNVPKAGQAVGRKSRFRRMMTMGNVIETTDAIGLSAFTVTGVYVAVTMNSTPLLLWGPLLAMLTGAGGGIIRDVVRADRNNPALKTSFYAEIPLFWGFILSGFFWLHGHQAETSDIFFAVVINVVGAFVMRMLIVMFGLKSPRF